MRGFCETLCGAVKVKRYIRAAHLQSTVYLKANSDCGSDHALVRLIPIGLRSVFSEDYSHQSECTRRICILVCVLSSNYARAQGNEPSLGFSVTHCLTIAVDCQIGDQIKLMDGCDNHEIFSCCFLFPGFTPARPGSMRCSCLRVPYGW